jgi:hypothetical protein
MSSSAFACPLRRLRRPLASGWSIVSVPVTSPERPSPWIKDLTAHLMAFVADPRDRAVRPVPGEWVGLDVASDAIDSLPTTEHNR